MESSLSAAHFLFYDVESGASEMNTIGGDVLVTEYFVAHPKVTISV